MAITINGKSPIPPGPPGKSAYQVAAEGGYLGTEAEFNAALAGIDNKLDKISGAVEGNLAALDAAGSLADSGKKPADFATAAQGAKADAALPKTGGTMTGNLVAAPKTDLTAVGVVNTVAVTDVANVPADLPNGSLVAVVEAAAATALTYDVIPVEEAAV